MKVEMAFDAFVVTDYVTKAAFVRRFRRHWPRTTIDGVEVFDNVTIYDDDCGSMDVIPGDPKLRWFLKHYFKVTKKKICENELKGVDHLFVAVDGNGSNLLQYGSASSERAKIRAFVDTIVHRDDFAKTYAADFSKYDHGCAGNLGDIRRDVRIMLSSPYLTKNDTMMSTEMDTNILERYIAMLMFYRIVNDDYFVVTPGVSVTSTMLAVNHGVGDNARLCYSKDKNSYEMQKRFELKLHQEWTIRKRDGYDDPISSVFIDSITQLVVAVCDAGYIYDKGTYSLGSRGRIGERHKYIQIGSGSLVTNYVMRELLGSMAPEFTDVFHEVENVLVNPPTYKYYLKTSVIDGNTFSINDKASLISQTMRIDYTKQSADPTLKLVGFIAASIVMIVSIAVFSPEVGASALASVTAIGSAMLTTTIVLTVGLYAISRFGDRAGSSGYSFFSTWGGIARFTGTTASIIGITNVLTKSYLMLTTDLADKLAVKMLAKRGIEATKEMIEKTASSLVRSSLIQGVVTLGQTFKNALVAMFVQSEPASAEDEEEEKESTDSTLYSRYYDYVYDLKLGMDTDEGYSALYNYDRFFQLR